MAKAQRWYPNRRDVPDYGMWNSFRVAFDHIYSQADAISGLSAKAAAPSGKSDPPSQFGVGPSNSQILGLNVKAVTPVGGQAVTYNEQDAQWETTNVVAWTTDIPATHTAPGVQGTIAFDPTGVDQHLYICVATNSWFRVGISNSF